MTEKYLLALAQDVPGDDSYVFENTTATGVEDGQPCTVSTERGSITANAVVVTTHFPVFDKARYYERLSPKRSYVLAVRLDDVPEGILQVGGAVLLGATAPRGRAVDGAGRRAESPNGPQ